MSCFNAGQDGNGIILQYGRWKLISERYTPKLIIYDITADFDLKENDNMAYVDRLKPFCKDASVKKYVSCLFPMERVKLFSNLYRYNYKFLEMVFDCLHSGDYMATFGYLPLYSHIRNEIVQQSPSERTVSMPLDVDKLFYLEQLTKEANNVGTRVMFVVSPSWKGGPFSLEAYAEVQEIARKYSAYCFEYIDSSICINSDYFADSYHLNDKGARTFTNDIVTRILFNGY